MALPSSGQLSINQIRNELGSSSGSLRTLSSIAGFGTPDAISEFYGYPSTPVYITVASGLYPVTGPSSTTTGTIYNNNAFSIYLILVFNSGGQSSGTVSNDILTVFIPGQNSIAVYGTITGSGTTLTSEFNAPLYTGINVMPANSSYSYDLQKSDGFGSGSTLRIYYSNALSGPYSPIVKI